MIREEAMVIEWSSDPHPADREIWDSSVHDEIQKLRDFVLGHRGGICSTIRRSRIATGKQRTLGNIMELMGYHFIDIVKSQVIPVTPERWRDRRSSWSITLAWFCYVLLSSRCPAYTAQIALQLRQFKQQAELLKQLSVNHRRLLFQVLAKRMMVWAFFLLWQQGIDLASYC